ncbi:MAG: baeRF10 domain-containing protein [Actinomycetes bacterium]
MISAETVERLHHVQVDGLPVVSAYVGVSPEDTTGRQTQSRVSSLMHDVRALLDDQSLDREARLSLRGDIEQIEGMAAEGRWQPKAVALFSCSGRGLFEQVNLPRSVRDRIVVDSAPWTRPMMALLDEYHRSIVVVVDRAQARYWELFQDELQELEKVRDPVLRKPNYAGWYGLQEHTVSDKAGELEKKHFRGVAEHLARLTRSGAYELVVVGGHPDETGRLIEYLPKALRSRVAGQFVIDPNTLSPRDVREKADEIVTAYERDEERRLVDDVLGRVAAGRLGAAGPADCLRAGSLEAVQQLLVHDETVLPGVVCDTCGWLGLQEDICPVSGDATRKVSDVIDELAASVIDHGGTVEHVVADTPLREHTLAAALRFPLPPAT